MLFRGSFSAIFVSKMKDLILVPKILNITESSNEIAKRG